MASENFTFLTNYSHVRLSIAAEPEISIRVGITGRAAQRIVAGLIETGYLTAEKVGRRNRSSVHANLPLRHPVERENQVSALLALARPDGKGAFLSAARTTGKRLKGDAK